MTVATAPPARVIKKAARRSLFFMASLPRERTAMVSEPASASVIAVTIRRFYAMRVTILIRSVAGSLEQLARAATTSQAGAAR
jgi:hypothetical protein